MKAATRGQERRVRKAISFLEFEALHGFPLSPAQAVLARVAFDGVEPRDLQGADREIAAQLFGATVETFSAAARSTLMLLKGARIGGSCIYGGHYSLWRALTADLSQLATGERATALIVGPDLRIARQTMRFALGVAKSLPDVRAMIESETSDGFVLRRSDGKLVAIECLPATRGGSALRGRTLVSVVFSEAAFFRDENSAVNDAELFRAAAPRVIPGGMVVLESTPWAEAGLAYDLFTGNYDKPTIAIAALAPTPLMRPDARMMAVVERELARDPIAARQEFFAEFLASGAGSFFDGTAIAGCVDHQRSMPLPPVRGARVFAAFDLAFVNDTASGIVVRLEEEQAVLADWLELRPRKGHPLKPSEVIAAFAVMMKAHGVTTVIGDGHYRESAREHLQSHGLRFVPADGGLQGKLRSYRLAQSLIKEQRVALPNLPKLITQLREVQVKPLPGGSLQISHPRRQGAGHGDLSAALVLGLAAAAPFIQRGGVRTGGVGQRRSVMHATRHPLDMITLDPYGRIVSRPRMTSAFGRDRGGSFGGF